MQTKSFHQVIFAEVATKQVGLAGMAWLANLPHECSYLLSELRNGQGTILLRAAAGKRSEARHEEVEAGEWNHVDSKFAKIGIELPRESKAGRDTRHR